MMNYEKDIQIDENALDVELLNQSELAMQYGKHWADCYRNLQQAEENIKLVRSELIELANADPEEHLGAGVKPTKDNIESFYRNHEEHVKAKNEWIQAQYELNIADIAKKEISVTRKAMLLGLIELHGMNYFAGPITPRDLSFEAANKRKERQKSSDSKISSKLKRKRNGRETD